MILQELIRNYVLYREVLKPILTSWRDSLAASYYNEINRMPLSELSFSINKAKVLVDGGDGEELGWDISDEYEAMSINKISGSRTITKHIISSISSFDLLVNVENNYMRALPSKDMCIVLADDLMSKQAAMTSKTYNRDNLLSSNSLLLGTPEGISATTGYANQQINSFLFETHEKREYLGEFSLTHEETPLMVYQEGGENHDAY